MASNLLSALQDSDHCGDRSPAGPGIDPCCDAIDAANSRQLGAAGGPGGGPILPVGAEGLTVEVGPMVVRAELPEDLLERGLRPGERLMDARSIDHSTQERLAAAYSPSGGRRCARRNLRVPGGGEATRS